MEIKDIPGVEELKQKEILVSLLQNAIYYFLGTVLIVRGGENYRLIVLSGDKQILMDEEYNSARGARISFTKKWTAQVKPDETEADWSHFYRPEEKWFIDNGMRISIDEGSGQEYVVTVI